MYFHFELPERQIKKGLSRAGPTSAGVFVVSIADSSASADIARTIDAEFKNSLAETLTETEKAFHARLRRDDRDDRRGDRGRQLRRHPDHHGGGGEHDGDDRARALSEYATLKALGFPPRTVALLILAEAMLPPPPSAAPSECC